MKTISRNLTAIVATALAGCASIDRTAQTIYQATQQTAPAEEPTHTAEDDTSVAPIEYTRYYYLTLISESKGIISEPIETFYTFHETGRLEDGTPVGRLGALTYLLNDKGVPVSPGLHGIVKIEEGEHAGGYVGNRGARVFLLHSNGWPYLSLENPPPDGMVHPDELDGLLYKKD